MSQALTDLFDNEEPAFSIPLSSLLGVNSNKGVSSVSKDAKPELVFSTSAYFNSEFTIYFNNKEEEAVWTSRFLQEYERWNVIKKRRTEMRLSILQAPIGQEGQSHSGWGQAFQTALRRRQHVDSSEASAVVGESLSSATASTSSTLSVSNAPLEQQKKTTPRSSLIGTKRASKRTTAKKSEESDESDSVSDEDIFAARGGVEAYRSEKNFAAHVARNSPTLPTGTRGSYDLTGASITPYFGAGDDASSSAYDSVSEPSNVVPVKYGKRGLVELKTKTAETVPSPVSRHHDGEDGEDNQEEEEEEEGAEKSYLYDFNAIFQQKLDELRSVSANGAPGRGQTQKLEAVYTAIIRLGEDFVKTALAYAKIIINERYLPVRHKTIKPSSNLGGILGGEKYVVHKMLFKFAIDSKGVFRGRDDASAKVAGHELKVLCCVVVCLCLCVFW